MSSASARPAGIFCTLYRGFVLLVAVFLVLWIGFSGLAAVSKNPYMVPAFWFLGVLGLMGCVAACLNVLPGGEEETEKPPSFGKAAAFLAVAFIAAALLWTQGRPTVDGSGPEFAVVGVLLVTLAFVGLAGLILLPVFFWFSPDEDLEEPGMIPAE